MKPGLLTAAKAALKALETCDWNDNDFPDDTQYFDRFAVSEAATKLRAAIAEAEKQEPVLYMDNRTEVDTLRRILRDAYEVWAGSEGIPEPVYASEAYLYHLLVSMRDEVKRGL